MRIQITPLIALVVLLLSACTAVAPSPDDAAETASADSSSSETSDLRGEMVNYGPTEGYLSVPDGEGSHPAVILIHEWWGLNDNIRWYADKFADEGYVALAVDLYNGESTDTPEQARALATSVRENLQPAFANLEAAVDYLHTLPSVNDAQLASVGWCFGGGWSYEMAKNDMGVQASVMYYGQFAPEDDLEMMKSMIMGHFGEEDQSIPVDDVKAFRAKLHTLSGEHQIYIYENVGHGFARNLDNESAREAWERTLEFLRDQL